MWYVYILRTQNNNFYIGITNDVRRRFQEHKQGRGGHFTNYNRPVDLVYVEEFCENDKAESRERQLKRWSRAKKEALIKSNLERLRLLSVSRD